MNQNATVTDDPTLEMIVKQAEEGTLSDLVPAPNINKTLPISSDTVAMEMDKLVSDGRISTGEKALVLWFHGHLREGNYSMVEAGKLIHYNATTVSRLLRGTYEGRIDKVISAIRAYRQIISERSKMMEDDYIETSIWQQIRQTCDLAILRRRPVRIIGVSQIGKTRALQEYQRRSEYLVRYCRVPAAPRFRAVVETVAEACSISTASDLPSLRKRIQKSIDSNTLLIVDELHELAISAGRRTAMDAIEWLRELYDRTSCGLVVCGTRTMEDDLIYGPQRGWLDQFDQRCSRVLQLPVQIPHDDIRAIAKHYGMPDPDDRTMELLRTLRMNRLILSIQLASDIAERRNLSLDWDLFRSALATVRGE